MQKKKEWSLFRQKYPIVMVILTLIFVVLWIYCWWWPHPVTTIYISRHAEKLNSGSDPALSANGVIRAGNLAHVLKDAGIDAVFVTEFQRTQQTGSPTATQAGTQLTQYSAGDSTAVVNTILANHTGEQILIIGHSNTLDDIAAGLGASGVPELNESQFDRLFVVHRVGSTAHLDRLRYGTETP